jgi:hypothetical protein
MALVAKSREGSEKLKRLFAKPVAAKKRLVDGNAHLCAFSYSHRNKEYVARHVAGHINCHSACNIDPLNRGIGVQN